jgi:hypothetical protein
MLIHIADLKIFSKKISVPGNKSDVKDSKRITEMLRFGLIPASFIPPMAIRELRELNRTLRKLVGMMASEKNRI